MVANAEVPVTKLNFLQICEFLAVWAPLLNRRCHYIVQTVAPRTVQRAGNGANITEEDM